MLQEQYHLTARQNYDRLSRWYDLFSGGEQSLSKIGLENLMLQPGERILEIGFGTGHALLDMAHVVGETGHVDGIDLSPGMVSVACRHVQRSGMAGRITLQVGDATRLPFPDHHFQAAFMSFTLELFRTSEIPIVLAECWRVLSPGGRLGIVSLVREDTCTVKIYDWFHAHFPDVVDCSPIHVRELLDTANLVIERVVKKSLWGLPVNAVVAKKP